MTVIVGLVENNIIYVGGDRASTGSKQMIKANPKVFANGLFLFGPVGSCRAAQVLKYRFKPPKQKEEESDIAYMTTTFIDAIRKCFKEAGCVVIDNTKETGHAFVIGYKNKLYTVYSDYQVTESLIPYVALGSGESYALGSMFSTEGMEPKARITLALEAAAYSDAFCAPPFDIETLYTNDKGNKATPPKPGRNELCTCGSGKKYKNCCLDKV